MRLAVQLVLTLLVIVLVLVFAINNKEPRKCAVYREISFEEIPAKCIKYFYR